MLAQEAHAEAEQDEPNGASDHAPKRRLGFFPGHLSGSFPYDWPGMRTTTAALNQARAARDHAHVRRRRDIRAEVSARFVYFNGRDPRRCAREFRLSRRAAPGRCAAARVLPQTI